MKKTLVLSLSMFCIFTSMAQNINFDESAQNSLKQARNGSVALGDIDNDGDPDLIVIGQDGSPTSTLYTNDGSGNFTEVLGTSFKGLQFGNVGFADIDNDGDQDLLITGSDFAPNRFANLYLNDGIGNFSLAPNTPFESQSEGDFVFQDVDNDNDLDLLMTGYTDVGTSFGGHTTLYLNNGSGVFSEAAQTFEDLKASSIAFFDMDNDGDDDVLIAGENDNDVYSANLYANDGTGSFSLFSNTAFTGFALGDITTADTDNDGDIDVHICGQSNASKISELYLNDGTGNFSLLPIRHF